MNDKLISINELPPDGKEYSLDDQNIWLDAIREFKMDCKIIEPLRGKAHVQPVDEGVLVKGELRGTVSVPCNRCAEDATIRIDTHFSEYEEIPPEKNREEQEGYIVYERHAPMLDLAKVGWEQFMLALPVNPVCKDDCKGLCPQCGVNLNTEKCACELDAGDPRMAALRNLKVSR